MSGSLSCSKLQPEPSSNLRFPLFREQPDEGSRQTFARSSSTGVARDLPGVAHALESVRATAIWTSITVSIEQPCDLPPFSHPLIAGVFWVWFCFEIVFSPPSSGLWGLYGPPSDCKLRRAIPLVCCCDKAFPQRRNLELCPPVSLRTAPKAGDFRGTFPNSQTYEAFSQTSRRGHLRREAHRD